MENEIFTGYEAEGRLKGVPTVFSQRPCIEAANVCRKVGYTHIFFGARGHILTAGDYQELERLMFAAIASTWVVTVHVPLDRAHEIPAWVIGRCHVLLYQTVRWSTHLLAGDVEVKLESDLQAAIYSNPQMIDLHYVYDRNVACPS